MNNKSLLHQVDASRVLRRALSRGGEFADVFAQDTRSTLIELEAGRVDKLVQGSRTGAGVRLIRKSRTAYSYADAIADRALAECSSVAAAAATRPGRKAAVKAGEHWKHHLVPVAKDPEALSVEAKLKIMWRAERAARKCDRRVRQVKVIYADSLRRIAVANSQGLRAADSVTRIIFYVIVVAADESGIQVGRESLGGTTGLEMFAERSAEEVALLAARRALLNLTARPAPAGTMPVVLAAEAGGTMIHEAVGHGLEADLAEEGLSVYQGRVGQSIASPLVTVLDDATAPGKRGSFSIDDEGTPAQRTVLVDRGVLKGYMYDRRLAMKTGHQSTGNGRRESYESPPIVRMTNTMIAPGETPPEKILRSVERGLLVKRMGGGEVNTVNGDFVFEVEEGFLIQKGKQGEPVRGATLTGNGPAVLQKIDMVGTDLGFGIGTCGKDGQGVPVGDAQPTLRIPEIVVGGRVEKA